MSTGNLRIDKYYVTHIRGLYGFQLITGSVSIFITGLNVALFISYVYLFWRRDKLVTKIWTLLVILLNIATMVADVWSQWCQSITIFLYEHVKERLAALSSMTGLSSAVIMLVQIFWLGCIHRMMKDSRKVRWVIIVPSVFLSVCAFGVAILSCVFSRFEAPKFTHHQKYLDGTARISWLSAAIVVDFIILVTVLSQLITLGKRASNVRRPISLLSWIFLTGSIFSTAIAAVEIAIQTGNFTGYGTYDLGSLFAPVYAFTMLAMLNARTTFWENAQISNKGAPEMIFVQTSDPTSLPRSHRSRMSNTRETTFSSSRGESSMNTSTEDEAEKFHRHTIHVDREAQRQVDFGTMTEP